MGICGYVDLKWLADFWGRDERDKSDKSDKSNCMDFGWARAIIAINPMSGLEIGFIP